MAKLLPSAKSSVDEIERYRERLVELREALAQAENAPADAATVKARVAAFVSSEIRGANERLIPGRLTTPDVNPGSMGDLGLGSAFGRNPVGALVVFLGRDAVEKAILAIALQRASGGIAPHERAARIASATSEILKIEAAEEAIIRGLEARGEFFERRIDANVDVVLAVDLAAVEVEP